MTPEEKLAQARAKYGREFKCNRKVEREQKKPSNWDAWRLAQEQKRVGRLRSQE